MYLNGIKKEVVSLLRKEVVYLAEISNSLLIGNIVAAENLNENISDTNLIESNFKTVNAISISRQQSEDFIFSANDSLFLIEIAYQNGVEGGRAVYKARALLRLRLTDDFINANRTLPTFSSGKESSVLVYPNPANESFTISLINSESSINEIELTDVAGRLIFKELLSNNSLNYKLSLIPFVSGLYLIKVVTNDGTEYNKQINVIK